MGIESSARRAESSPHMSRPWNVWQNASWPGCLKNTSAEAAAGAASAPATKTRAIHVLARDTVGLYRRRVWRRYGLGGRRASAHAVAQVGHAGRLDDLGVGEAHRSLRAREERDALAEDHRHEVDDDLVQAAGVEDRAGQRRAGHRDDAVPGLGRGAVDGIVDPVRGELDL